MEGTWCICLVSGPWDQKMFSKKNVDCENLYLVDSPGCRNDEASGLYSIHLFEIQKYIKYVVSSCFE